MYRHKYKRRDDDAKKMNQSQSEPLVKLYIEMNIDSNGDSKIKYDHNLKYESKIKTTNVQPTLTYRKKKKKIINRRPKTASSSYRSPSSFPPYRKCLLSESKLGGVCNILSYCGQDYKTVGSGHPTYRNKHNTINNSPMFKEGSIVTSHLYKKRKEKKELSASVSVGRLHNNNFWQPNKYIERPSTAHHSSSNRQQQNRNNNSSNINNKSEALKLPRPKSAVFRSKTKSRPSSAQYLCNFERFYELDTKNNSPLISEVTNSKGTFHWAEAESIRLWNSKSTSNFSKLTSDRNLNEFEPIYNYKGGKLGVFRVI